ncbi:RNA polymerase sigma factor SigJ [Nocardioides sp. GXZ039]|uniref:RNA polymerase sigma factor SigJ n=1 Tax=Nocardioides sp. GXZ039 TaxID=3136018 RepID=UPI0030F37A3E
MTRAEPRDEASDFVDLRGLLFSIAYQMTGSVADAEDIVSEAYLRMRGARDRGVEIRSVKAYLSSTVTRLSIDHLRSARVQREVSVGSWMPEPLVGDAPSAEFERVELSDSLSLAFLVMLESLSPAERAVFVLREVFVFDYPQIARILDKSEASCRQLLHRARQHVEERKPRFDVDREANRELADRFFTALERGDLAPLIDLLSADVVMCGDGGDGPSWPRPFNGPERVLKVLGAVVKMYAKGGLHIEQTLVNGQPGAVVRDRQGRLLNVWALDIADGRIQTLRSILNPAKLQHLGPLVERPTPRNPRRRTRG